MQHFSDIVQAQPLKITKKIKISTTTVLKESFAICFNKQSHYRWYAQQADISSAHSLGFSYQNF